jgi:SAM-dependent methyltransferase
LRRPERVEPRSRQRGPAGRSEGSDDDSWVKLGQIQFDYLLSHGLQPGDRMLEIGCGDFRAGRLFIDYLDAGNYYGVDFSPDALLAAQDLMEEYKLQPKLPHLTLVRDLRLSFLPAEQFTVAHAHGVFAHAPIEVIDECLASIGRVMRRDGVFDFTFYRTDGEDHQLRHRSFYYRAQTLIAVAHSHGLDAEFMQDWEGLAARQSKIRVTRRG